MTVEQINKQEETEIDLIEVIRKLWAKRKFILKVTVVFMAFGVLIALFSPKEYTAGCTMVPQIGEKTTGGNPGSSAYACTCQQSGDIQENR